jgi:hypothetical protein
MITIGGATLSSSRRDSFERFQQIARSARASRQRAAHLRAEAASLILRSSEAITAARELSATSALLIAICLRTAFEAAWKASGQSTLPAELPRA